MAKSQKTCTAENCNEKLRARALEMLRYNPETGDLIWRVSRGAAKEGVVAGWTTNNGYLQIRISGREYRAHRIIWLMAHGRWPDADLDHVDGDRSNNRLENLREATRAENLQNTGLKSNNTSGHAGVSWEKRREKWQAYIGVNGKKKWLGYYEAVEDAAAAYARAKARLHTFHPDVVERDGRSAGNS